MTNHTSKYANFRDPRGLAIRMLKQAKYESLWPLFQASATMALKPVDRLVSRWERYRVDGVETAENAIPQVLIVGLPRSGTTLVSQILATYLDVSYFSNVCAMFPNAPIWASKRWLGRFDRAPSSTRSFYGNTTGLRGINDGFHIWNRWLGSNRYRIDHEPTDVEAKEMRCFFSTWNAEFQKPLLNKNNRNVDGIALLASLMPNAYFVVVERDLKLTVQSLLASRKFVQGSRDVGWGLFSERFEHVDDPIESTCKQVAYAQHRLREQLKSVAAERLLPIRYEHFCAAPQEALSQAVHQVKGLELRPSEDVRELPALRASAAVRLPPSDWERIADGLVAAEGEVTEATTSTSVEGEGD